MALFILSLLVQIGLAIHVAKTGRPLFWIMIIVFVPIVGPLVYVVVELIPDLRNNPGGRSAMRKVATTLNPGAARKRIEAKVAVADTVANRRALAEQCLEARDFPRAEELYCSCLKGVYATDPDLMLGLAKAQAAQDKYAECRATLETLIARNPDYRSTDGHLLYARSLEQLGEHERALKEYEALATSYPGEEARCRYGTLLLARERRAEARAVFDEMLARERAAPAYYRRKEKAWLDQARSALRLLGAA